MESRASIDDTARAPHLTAAPSAAAGSPRATPTRAGSAEAADGTDDVLRDIYQRETQAHISTIRDYVAHERSRTEPHEIPETVYRAGHTLSGSSKMADARHGIRLAQPLDHWLRRAFDAAIGLTSADLDLLSDSMDAMETVAAHLDESTGYFLMHGPLYGRIADAERRLDKRHAAAAEAAARTGQHLRPPPGMPGAPAAAEIAAAQPAAAPAPPPPPPSAPIAPDFDPEVASIFTEEATELIEVCERALSDWRAEPQNTERLAALKRPLHTLKGGARMAGITAMGDLSHELETLVNQIDMGSVAADDAAFDVLQASLDELARMRDDVAAGRGLAPANATGRIRALTNPYEAPPAAAPSAAAPAAPFVALSDRIEAELDNPTLPNLPVVETTGEWLEVSIPESPGIDGALETPEQPEAPIQLTDTDPAVEPSFARAEPAPVHSFEPPAPAREPIQAAVHAAVQARSTEPVFPTRRSATPAIVRSVELVSRSSAMSDSGSAESGGEDALVAPQPVPPGREPVAPSDRPEMARVDAELLDQLLNISGEVSISRARLEQQLGSIEFNLGELSRTVTRLKEQLRKLEIETEKQILHRHEDESTHRSDFDPLELDRYSTIQQFSRALAETASDVASIQQLLETLAQDTGNLLQQQARTVTELQNGLMRTRMVPFQRHVQRLARIVRQAASDTGKRAELVVEGASGELDRQVLERMLPAFEHMLRNAVVHGIESPEERVANGKPDAGRIELALHREGAEVMVRIRDDGAGMNLRAIREKGAALGLIPPGQNLSDEDAMQLVLEPGFSTAGTVTQQAGRGVGMDVVATEIKRLGGALHMETQAGQGTVFTIRLPFTLAISHALVVRTGDEFYALPLPTVDGVLRLSKDEVIGHLGRDAATFDYNGQKYRFQHLATFVGLEPSPLPEGDITVPVVMVRAGEHSTGLIADELIGSREIVVKSVGPQISSIRGISGATILGDGRIVIILDIGALVRSEWRGRPQQAQVIPSKEKTDRRVFALVVDDSITVRRVTQRLLERNGMRVLTARDGLDAVALLQENVPDIILLDIEMPRMDGYEVAAHVRNDERLKDVPIIMITSRVGEKHRARAIELGVDDYLGKPYQEAQLLDAIAPLVERHRETRRTRLEATG
jgi:chemosensory pili system protein ChpA (sensor histidine kinase/response regulator)